MKVFIGLVLLASVVNGAPAPDGDHAHDHAHSTPVVVAPGQVFTAHRPVFAPAPAHVFAPAPAQVFAPGPVFAPAPVFGPFGAPQPVFASVPSSKPFVFFGNKVNTPTATTTAAPEPTTTAAPETTTTSAPTTTTAPPPPPPTTTAAPPPPKPVAPVAPVVSIATPVVVAPSYGPPVQVEEAGPANYAYTYGVRDDLNGVNFGQNENRDGYLAQGQYFVSLPDGRLQTVTYHADGNGYVADVTYSGNAVVVEPKPTYN